jgi:two-component sensor histidine kinase
MERFEERVQALAASHCLLIRNSWQGALLEDLVRSQLAHFRDLIGSRIELHGPPILITASAAQAIGMALHELATNAGKYGALSNGTGGIRIEWRSRGEGTGDARFELSWSEHAGPAVTPPAHTGFGTVVIGDIPRAQLNAEVALTYAPEGFRWHLSCPAECIFEPPSATAGIAPPTA